MKATDFFHCVGQLTSINFRSSLSLKGNSNCWMFELLSSLPVISGNGRSPENQFHMLYKFWKVVIETNYFQCLNDKNLLCTWMLLCGKTYEHARGKRNAWEKECWSYFFHSCLKLITSPWFLRERCEMSKKKADRTPSLRADFFPFMLIAQWFQLRLRKILFL